jgi:hypothetical protein
MMLSDACIFRRNEKQNAWLYIEQKDKDFVFHLWGLFDKLGIVGAPPRERNRSGGRRSYAFSTFTLGGFTDLHSHWYTKLGGNSIQTIPANINELLGARALAYWISGDARSIRTRV